MIKKLVYIVGITLFACTLPAAAQDIKETKDTEDTQATGRYSDLKRNERYGRYPGDGPLFRPDKRVSARYALARDMGP